TLGVDGYIRKEIPIRPGHANDFFASIFLLRLALTVPIFLAMQGVMSYFHWPREVQVLVWILGLAQFVQMMNFSFAALLQAHTTVDGLSVINVGSKVAWGAASLVGVYLGYGINAVALALLLAESVKAIVCLALCQKHFDLSFASFGWGPAKVIVLATLPFYVNTVFHTVYNKIDVVLLRQITEGRLGVAAANQETGWYGAAAGLGGLSMLLVPLLAGVMMPLLARAKDADPIEYSRLIKRSLELVLTVAIPISLAIGIGSDVLIKVMIGDAYAPATLALRLLSPVYLFIYVSIISAVVLQLEDRAWTLAVMSGVGLVVNMVANLVLIGPAIDRYGASFGGATCALVQIVTEAGVAITMVAMMGRRSLDGRTVKMLLKTALVCAGVIALDLTLRQRLPQLPGLLRMVINGLAYLTGVVVFGAVSPTEMLAFARQAFRRKRAEPAAV
ncbi:MAG: polysaccharide biosynthesis protein, partial [Myxococcaceae bacterium]|nr:polysaccharide biosynthesis protein [Myxococcaceae bacterium]